MFRFVRLLIITVIFLIPLKSAFAEIENIEQALSDIEKMEDKTFGWTIEMQIKAIQKKLNIIELPVDTRCRIGISKISGTIKGSIGAGIGILCMIAKLWWQEHKSRLKRASKPAIT